MQLQLKLQLFIFFPPCVKSAGCMMLPQRQQHKDFFSQARRLVKKMLNRKMTRTSRLPWKQENKRDCTWLIKQKAPVLLLHSCKSVIGSPSVRYFLNFLLLYNLYTTHYLWHNVFLLIVECYTVLCVQENPD